jgi:hypothetical protein
MRGVGRRHRGHVHWEAVIRGPDDGVDLGGDAAGVRHGVRI